MGLYRCLPSLVSSTKSPGHPVRYAPSTSATAVAVSVVVVAIIVACATVVAGNVGLLLH